MKFSNLNFSLLFLVVGAFANSPIGFGNKTTGGQGGIEYHVNTFKELNEALNNNGNPTAPKIIYIDSPMNGLIDDNGKIITAEDLVPGYSFQKYLECFSEDGLQWLDTEECNNIEELRKQGTPIQEKFTKAYIPSNTSIIGHGDSSHLEEISLTISNADNVIIKNLSIEAPNDFFTKWDPTDGIHGSWNAQYDNIVITNSTNVWVDNCYLTDGKKSLDKNPIIFGKHIEYQDGLLDIIKGSDLITLSNNLFESHHKTMLIGNSDKRTDDRNHLRVTITNNVFFNCIERLPRVRFGKIHILNNYFYAETFHQGYPALTFDNYFKEYNVGIFPSYFIGLGIESNVLSEYNSFNIVGSKEIPATDDIIVFSYGGNIFHDNKSEFNGKNIDIDVLAERSFKLKVNGTIVSNAELGKSNPNWVNATFSSETFQPTEYYDYKVIENIDKVNDLVNKVPTWMFDNDSESNVDFSNDEEDVIINDDDDSDVYIEDSEDSADDVTTDF